MNHNLHGKLLRYTGSTSFECIPRRNRWLDPIMVNKTDAIISNKNDKLLFLPNSIKEFSEKDANSKKSKYKILMFGILPDGRKTAVILEGIQPYFEVRKPDNMDVKTFGDTVNGILSEKYKCSYSKEVNANGFNEFESEKILYRRLFFSNSWDRKQALKYFIEVLEWETTTDDNNHFERVVCRNNNFSLCAWNEIKDYSSYAKENICKLDKVFRVHYKDMVVYDGDISEDPLLSRDKTMVETWDIEAYTDTGEMPNPDFEKDVVFAIGMTYHWKDDVKSILDVCLVSRPCNPRPDKLTVVCGGERDLIKSMAVLSSIMQPDFKIGFNDGDFDWPFIIKKATRHGILTYVRDQLTLVNVSKEKWDSGKRKVVSLTKKETVELILRWDCQKKRIKLEADTVAYSTTLESPGCINIDVRTMFRKLYPTEPKSSLKFYLLINNLAGKEDMLISKMFGIYKESVDVEEEISRMTRIKNIDNLDEIEQRFVENKEKMADVAHYCTIDAKRCQELLQKVNIITDKREVSNVSHTSLYDAIYYADGMKVRNLVIAEGQPRGLLFSTRSKPYIGDGKYPGAYVFPPIKGVAKPKLSVRERKLAVDEWKDVPDTDLKQMECIVYNHASNPSELKKHINYNMDDYPFDNNKSGELFKQFINEENKYPTSGLDFSSLYPSIIMTYNLSPEYMVFDYDKAKKLEKKGHTLHKIDFMFNNTQIIAWSIRHDTFDGVRLLTDKTQNNFGLYPYILKKLFDKRAIMKKGMKKYAAQKEILENKGEHDTDEYAKVCFNYNYINSKQKALKVFMNTFYGETGNKLSPFFVLAIAGGITSAGQRNIKMVADLVTARGCDVIGETGNTNTQGCRLYYGDTDSVYISCPSRHFVELDKQYYSGRMEKKEYCTQVVLKTFERIEVIKNIVNKFLIQDNGTGFLRMAFEEVLWPVIYLLKKMYAGIEHQKLINFEPHVDELFTKGLSLKRRGTSEVLKTVCKEVLMEILNIKNIHTTRTIVQSKIKEIYDRKWKMEDFKKTAVYKPSKQNISVRTFIKRMEERNDVMCPMPQPGERFEYVVVKKYPFKYDIKGRKTKLKIGEMWEYYTYAITHSLKIDLDYYMSGGIIGQFAQFVAYHPDYQVRPTDDSPEAYDIAEKKTLITSKKYIEAICKQMANTPVCQGPILKELYKIAKKTYTETLKGLYENEYNEGNEKIELLSLDYSGTSNNLYQYLRTIIHNQVKESSAYYAECYIDHMTSKYGKKIIFPLLKIFSNTSEPLLKYRTLHVARIENNARKIFKDNIKQFENLFRSRDSSIRGLMSSIKNSLNMDNLDEMASRGSLPDHKTFSCNPAMLEVLDNKEYAQSIVDQKINIDKLYDIYNTLEAALTYLENTKAIVERLNYYIAKSRQENPKPPGINIGTEHDVAMEYIKHNLIDF